MRKGDAAIKRLIDQGLEETTVTAVLIGEQTAYRPYVDYEIDRSLARGNGLIGVRIHNLRDQFGRTTLSGPVPQRLLASGAPVYTWSDARSFGSWVEASYQQAQRAPTNPFRI